MLSQKKPWPPPELFLLVSCNSSPCVCGTSMTEACTTIPIWDHPYSSPGGSVLPSPIPLLWLLPLEYDSLVAGHHPHTTAIPLTSRQQHIVQGSSCNSWTSIVSLWMGIPLVSGVSWRWRRWICAEEFWWSRASARSFQGHADTAGKTKSFEQNKPQ